MKKVLTIIGFLLLGIVLIISCLAFYVKVALPNVGPAPVMKVELTPERIKRGEYLANHVMVCMDCHSEHDWSRFSGPMVPGTLGKGGEVFDQSMGFPGKYYAPNITPAGLSSWTDGEIFRAITTGVRKNGKPIFPVMPHPYYGQLDEEDIKSVIAYVRTIPPIDNKVPSSEPDFPMNFIINTIPQKARLSKRPEASDKINYGKYLLTAAACKECHTPVKGGKTIESLFMAGGRKFVLPGGVVTSANLTPDKETGLGNWSREDFINRFRRYRDSAVANQHVSATEFNTLMPWTMLSGMTDEDLYAIYNYLQTVKPVKQAIVKFQPATAKR